MQSWRWQYLVLLCIACVLLGAALVWALPILSPSLAARFASTEPAAAISADQIKSYRGAVLRQSSINYDYIAPLLACDVGSEDAFPEFAPLKDILTKLIAKEKATGQTQNASIYLRSLKSARWFEINGTQTYAPASLFKIFVMMAYYKEASETDNPSLLQQKVVFHGTSTTNDAVGGTIVHLTNGQLYTVDQLINQMIIYSDNDAFNTLLANFNPTTLGRLQTIFQDLNIPLPLTSNEALPNFMSVTDYSMVFRVLYGSTYLTERYSEKALGVLAEAGYVDGIVAGVPTGFQVAHKYGVLVPPATTTASVQIDQLHDCGIVYYPGHPYLLCVMTSGTNLLGEQKTIVDISAASYKWLDVFYNATTTAATSTPSIVRP